MPRRGMCNEPGDLKSTGVTRRPESLRGALASAPLEDSGRGVTPFGQSPLYSSCDRCAVNFQQMSLAIRLMKRSRNLFTLLLSCTGIGPRGFGYMVEN